MKKLFLDKNLIKIQEETKKAFNTPYMNTFIKSQEEIGKSTATIKYQMNNSKLFRELKNAHTLLSDLLPKHIKEFLTPEIKEIIQVTEDINTKYEPEDLVDDMLKAKDVYLKALKKCFDADYVEYDAVWEVADEYSFRWKMGTYDSLNAAYEDALKNTTIKGKPIAVNLPLEDRITRLHIALSRHKKNKPEDLKSLKI